MGSISTAGRARCARASLFRASCLAVAVLAGCYPVTRVQGPRTTPTGKLNAAIALGVRPTGEPDPTPDIALRVGLADRVDLGVRLRLKAVEIGPKIQLVRDAVEVSIAPAFLAAADEDHTFDETTTTEDNVNVIASRTSVYVGTNAGKPVSAFIAPTLDVGERTFRGAEAGEYRTLLLAPGVLSGVMFALNPSVRVLLELGLLFPAGGVDKVTPYANDEYIYQTKLGPGDTRIELGVALMLGSYD
jgi:hypothetical protein